MSNPSKQRQLALAIEESLTRLMATIRSLELLIETVRKYLRAFQQAERESGTTTSNGQKRKAQTRTIN